MVDTFCIMGNNSPTLLLPDKLGDAPAVLTTLCHCALLKIPLAPALEELQSPGESPPEPQASATASTEEPGKVHKYHQMMRAGRSAPGGGDPPPQSLREAKELRVPPPNMHVDRELPDAGSR
jgi:hypothetical protein